MNIEDLITETDRPERDPDLLDRLPTTFGLNVVGLDLYGAPIVVDDNGESWLLVPLVDARA